MKNKSSNKTLFNKNHISITKKSEEPGYNDNCRVTYDSISTRKSAWWEKDYDIEVKESPLGFYYEKKVYRRAKYESKTLVNYRFYFSNGTLYDIIYYNEYNSNKIGPDLRPWEIADEKSMPEHFVFDLKKVIDDILSEVKDKKNMQIIQGDGNKKDFQWLKNSLYTDLFGDKKGIRFQTNEEKIVSHGFDLKESFRKDKSNS